MQPQNTRNRGETAVPKNLQALVEREGVTKAAKHLGISTTTIHKARTQGMVSKVVEVAAAGMLKRPAGVLQYAVTETPERVAPEPRSVISEVPNLNPSLDTTLYLIEVPEAKAAIVERFAEALGAHVLKA